MATFLIIAAVAAVVYLYALIAYYYGFKNWNPMYGCYAKECDLKAPKGPVHSS